MNINSKLSTIAVSSSLILHILLVMLLLLVHVQANRPLTEYIEVDLVAEPPLDTHDAGARVGQASPEPAQESVVPPLAKVAAHPSPMPVPASEAPPNPSLIKAGPVVKNTATPVSSAKNEPANTTQPAPPVSTSRNVENPVIKAAVTSLTALSGIGQSGIGPETSGTGQGSGGDQNKIQGPVARRGVRQRIEPVYPESARRAGLEDDVELWFWVDPEGNVISVEPETKSGYFDEAAMRAMRSWKFAALDPRLPRNDQWGKVTIRFRLEH